MSNTVLIVEDYATSLQMWVLMLQKQGYKTLEATKAYSAIDLARKYIPDLILCDFILGGMITGSGVLARIRKEPTTCQIPFVMMYGGSHLLELRSKARFIEDAYLIKPFNTDKLINAIHPYLNSKTGDN